MKIDSKDKEIRKVLETGYYFVPRFQRPYSWEKDHINEFWSDTLVESETDYFIGSIVVYKINDEKYGIVDGQQRLTTITMILCAVRDAYINEGLTDLAKGIHTQIERMDLSNKRQYVLQTETSYPYFQEHIQKFDTPDVEEEIGPEEENLKNGFELITWNIQKLVNEIKANKQLDIESKKTEIQSKLSELRDRVLKLKVIYIELDNEDDAYIIFETLNTRGKDLTVSDLVKNHLTKLIKTDNENVDLPKDKWNSVRETIEDSGPDLTIDSFLLHEWLSKYEYTSSKKLFKKLKSTVKKATAKTFLDELISDAKIYKSIFSPTTHKWKKEELELKASLTALNTFNVTQQTPITLSILREYFSGRIKLRLAIDALKSIENFHYIFTAITSQRSSGGISSMYSLSARNLYDAGDLNEKQKAITELKLKMRERLPSFDEFLPSFKNLMYLDQYQKEKKIIQYTLSKIDKHLNKAGVSIDYDTMTLEHILPQNPKKSLANFEATGQVGNLILLSGDLNQKLSNKEFKDKKQILLRNPSVHVDDIIKESIKWDKEEVDKRTKWMADIAYGKIFRI